MADTHPLSLWLTDRSRYTTGTGRCKRLRYLTNHWGPTGYGIVRKSESLPLATGKYQHLALEGIFRHLQATDTFPTVDIIRGSIQAALAEYEQRIVARGFRGLLANQTSDEVLVEQQALITGLTWAACRTVLPWLHRHFRILETELESIYVLDCTCGLGSGVLDAKAHAAKGCLGIGQMLKQDVIAQPRSGNPEEGLAYLEIKTSGWVGDTWATQWETKPQLPIGTFGVEERLGLPVRQCYIIGLYKGRREKSKYEGDETVRQSSPFCYGFCRPGNPPLAPDDWVPSYEWTTDQGETKRKSRAHVKRAVWELPFSDWPVWEASQANDPSLSPAEFWAMWLPQSVVEKQVFLVGPMQTIDVQVDKLKRMIVGEEHHWQDLLWQLHDYQLEGHGWESREFQAKLDALVPASYECRKFGATYECEMTKLCFEQAGWENPFEIGYVPRRPHHQPELDVAVERGLLPEIAEEDESEERE